MNKEIIIEILNKRFHAHMHRHPHVSFQMFLDRLSKENLETIIEMEKTMGEPDLVIIGETWYVVDMVTETPQARANVCYDEQARLSRKKFPPKTSALEEMRHIGTICVDEALYYQLQSIEDFDLKTSSWLLTDPELRHLGGALFGDKRYQRTFIYHNGADSYYGVRGYRGYIRI